MATKAFKIEWHGELRLIAVDHAYCKVSELVKRAKEKFGITELVDLTCMDAQLDPDDILHDLELTNGTPLRLKVRQNHHESSIQINQIQNSLASDLDASTNPTKVDQTRSLVFLSYNSDHKMMINALSQQLKKDGIICWVDFDQVGGGDNLNTCLERGIRETKVFACCITRNYVRSGICRQELEMAANLKKPIVPIILEEMQWPPENLSIVLSGLVYIRLHTFANRNPPWLPEKYTDLLNVLKRILSRA